MRLLKQDITRMAVTGMSVALLTACAGWLPATGPSYGQVGHGENTSSTENIAQQARVVDVDESILAQMPQTASSMGNSVPAQWRMNKPNLPLGAGDGVQVSIFEAPPAVLLSSAASNSSDLSIGTGSGVMNLPEQMVSQRGTIVVPFAGEVPVAGKTLSQVEQTIRARLAKIANQPQVVARLTQNASNSVVVLADGRSLRLSLTAKGERLLDALPLAGDAKKVKSTSIRLTRNGMTRSISVSELSQNTANNIYLQPNDVVAVLQDPYKITVLGATNANAAVDFGDEGITVAEALGRVAGLNDYRADPRGVFVFRRAERVLNDESRSATPTIYRLDVRDARGMVLAQNFRLRDKDMMYVSNAPSVQWQKVWGVFNSALGTAANAVTTVGAF